MLEVIEIIRKIEQGRTEPYLCGANDGNAYVVKGKTTTGKGRIVEYICAHIGKAFELPIPLRHRKTMDFSFSGLKTASVPIYGHT